MPDGPVIKGLTTPVHRQRAAGRFARRLARLRLAFEPCFGLCWLPAALTLWPTLPLNADFGWQCPAGTEAGLKSWTGGKLASSSRVKAIGFDRRWRR
jgi:hypothetical protein